MHCLCDVTAGWCHCFAMQQELYPGYFVPPRPSRNALEGYRMTPKFIEDRRSSVERFLNRCVSWQDTDSESKFLGTQNEYGSAEPVHTEMR